jgi:(heptosyl)LPS beta-1,4-glucosyltransferase
VIKISVVINTLNEEINILRAITSVKDFADEIVVVDMYSEDKTTDIAKSVGASVYFHKRTGYVEPARNYAISKAKGNWVFILDADEELQESLAKKLKEVAASNKADYYAVPRKNIIFGKWIKHSRWWPDLNIRFFKKDSVVWGEIIHSIPVTVGRGADLEAKEDFAVIHHHYDSIEQYIERMNRYTSEHARLLVKDGYKFKWSDLIKKPTAEFLSRYFFGEGYKDGLHGLALAGLQAVSELVMYLKVWQTEGFRKKDIAIGKVISKMKEAERELNYWQADAKVKNGGGIEHKIRRKLRI